MTKRRIIRSHPTTANVTRWAARKAARMPKIERVRSVSAEMWLVYDKKELDWLLSSRLPEKQFEDPGYEWNCPNREPSDFMLGIPVFCAKKLFNAKLDPDAPPRRVRVTIELIDE